MIALNNSCHVHSADIRFVLIHETTAVECHWFGVRVLASVARHHGNFHRDIHSFADFYYYHKADEN